MIGRQTGRQVFLGQGRSHRKNVLETLASDQVLSIRAFTKPDGIAMELTQDPFRVVEIGKTLCIGIKKRPRTAGKIPRIVGDLSQ